MVRMPRAPLICWFSWIDEAGVVGCFGEDFGEAVWEAVLVLVGA